MKNEREIRSEIKATIHLAGEISQVEPSLKLKQEILARLEAGKAPIIIPFYRRVGFAVAAAVLIFTVNAVTLAYYLNPQTAVENSSDASDRYSDIRATYSLDESFE